MIIPCFEFLLDVVDSIETAVAVAAMNDPREEKLSPVSSVSEVICEINVRYFYTISYLSAANENNILNNIFQDSNDLRLINSTRITES